MSDSNSTGCNHADKPAKPTADFPLFPHATRRWAKKISGKMHYFGHWDDAKGALHAYKAFLAGGPSLKLTRRVSSGSQRVGVSDKPAKPYPEFPLFAHATGRWAKKIRGRLHYFGPWVDPDGAVARYLEQKDALHAGRKPKPEPGAVTVKDVANAFLNGKQQLVKDGELSPRTWAGYQIAADELVAHLGKMRIVADLDAADFAALRNRMAKKWGPHRLGTTVQYVRSIFKNAYEAGLIPSPMRFGPGFKRPTKKTMRLHRAKHGPKMFKAEEIHRLIAAAGPALKAMILLGINAGFGNGDCATLPLSAVDLESGWVDFARPKTGIPRRCPLWPETVQAIKEALAKRQEPKDEKHRGLLFITKYGESWGKDTSTNPVSQEMGKLLRAWHINRHKGLGFYALRHTFRTVADETKDQAACDHIMGHEAASMAVVYREHISDARLQAVTDYVRAWLFPETKQAP
jgi:integrase